MAEGEEAVVPATLQISEIPVLYITVVGFHHQKGSTVEYIYPPLSSLTTESDSLTSSLPPQLKPLPHIALPDGCHNYQEGSVVFTLPQTTKDCAFGVSCYRQIDSKEIQDKDSEVTRSTIQKAICVLTRYPAFSVVEPKVKLATHAYFNSKNFNDKAILVELYEDLNYSLTQDHALGVCLQGYDLTCIVKELDHRLLQIVKTVLLRKTVLIHGSDPGQISSMVMAIASLLPLSLKSLIRHNISDDMGFPLALLPVATCLQPYVPLQQMNMLANKDQDSVVVLAGTVNPLFTKQHEKFADVFYNVQTKQLVINNVSLRTPLNLTSPDLRFSDSLKKALVDQKRGEGLNPEGWRGGEDWIRHQYRLYIMSLLSTTVNGDSIAFDDYNSDFVQLFMKTDAYVKWSEGVHTGMESVAPKHVCEGDLSLSDIRRQLTVRAEEYGLDKVVTPTQVEQVGEYMEL